MRKKLKNNRGFMLIEMLCVVVILVMLSLMMNVGVQTAAHSYHDITVVSEADLLMSSLADALTDKLRYAVVTRKDTTDDLNITTTTYATSVGDVKREADGTLTWECVKVDVDGRVTVDGKQLLPTGAYRTRLLPDGSYTQKYQVKTAEITTDPAPFNVGDTVTFKIELEITETGVDNGIKGEFAVRCLNPVQEEVD